MKTNVAPRGPRETTHEGTPAKVLAPEQELRRTLLSCLLWEDNYYESGEDAAARLRRLVLAVKPEIAAALAVEARTAQKLRHAPLWIAAALVEGDAAQRRVVGGLLEAVIQRPDELTEFLALYWKAGRRKLAAQVKKGLARAFAKFDAYQLAKYDRPGAVQLRDVMFLTHPKPKDDLQAATWKALAAGALPAPDTWEVALSAGADKLATWTRLILEGKLGALALLRNLRNAREAGVQLDVLRGALATVRLERVLPFRFIAAARHAPPLEPALEAAMFRCLAGVPKLPGMTALVIDTSPSMWMAKLSERSEMDRFEGAAAVAMLAVEACESVRVYAFNERGYEVAPRRGFALRDALAATKGSYSCGGLGVMLANRDGYDRILVITDGQWHYSNAAGTGPAGRHGEASVVAPAPLTPRAYLVNVGTYRRGVGYGKWTEIDGWSEAVLDYVRAAEGVAAIGTPSEKPS